MYVSMLMTLSRQFNGVGVAWLVLDSCAVCAKVKVKKPGKYVMLRSPAQALLALVCKLRKLPLNSCLDKAAYSGGVYPAHWSV